MLHQVEPEARYQAYRWFRRSFPDATHQQAWAYAQANWSRFRVRSEPLGGGGANGRSHPPG
jgi:hypothetical protein